VVMRLSKKTI